jgi:hypothetical protein
MLDAYRRAFFERYLTEKNPAPLDRLVKKPVPKLVSYLKSDQR